MCYAKRGTPSLPVRAKPAHVAQIPFHVQAVLSDGNQDRLGTSNTTVTPHPSGRRHTQPKGSSSEPGARLSRISPRPDAEHGDPAGHVQNEEVGRKPVSWPAKCCRGNALTSGTPGSHERCSLTRSQQDGLAKFSAKGHRPAGGLPRPFFSWLLLTGSKPGSHAKKKLFSTKASSGNIRALLCSGGAGRQNTEAVQGHCQACRRGRDPGNLCASGESGGGKRGERHLTCRLASGDLMAHPQNRLKRTLWSSAVRLALLSSVVIQLEKNFMQRKSSSYVITPMFLKANETCALFLRR